jgi:hypothetical protein
VYLRIDRAVELIDPTDLTRFHATCPSTLNETDLRAVLTREGVGDIVSGDDAHLLVRVDALRRLAAGRVEPDWDTKFDGMLGYAKRKGWLSDDGTSVQAHLVREDH